MISQVYIHLSKEPKLLIIKIIAGEKDIPHQGFSQDFRNTKVMSPKCTPTPLKKKKFY